MTERRFIRDTVANHWQPSWKPELDRRLAWLDRINEEITNVQQTVRLHVVGDEPVGEHSHNDAHSLPSGNPWSEAASEALSDQDHEATDEWCPRMRSAYR